MAKISVSVPDELLDRARAVDDSANTSQLVQRGLEQLTAHLTGSNDPEYARRPDDVEDLLSTARERLLARARTEYERGYRAGADDVGELDWAFMERLADARFDLLTKFPALRRDLTESLTDKPVFSPPGWFGVLAKRFGTMIDPIGFDQWSFTPTRPFVRGYAAALSDAWAIVESEQTGRSTEHGPEPAETD